MALKVMIIDDEPFARDDLRYMLEVYTDIEISWEADRLEDAKKIIKENRPDLIFLDVQLRGGSGFDLLPEIQSVKSQFIFVTAHEGYSLEAEENGAVDCLLKPVSALRLGNAMTHLRQRIQAKQCLL